MALSILRGGVTRAREELEALAKEPVHAITAASPKSAADQSSGSDYLAAARIFIGTQAVLHRLQDVSLVAFLDFDQELLAPRYRAAEEALALLMLSSRLVGGREAGRVGGREGGGRVVVQTRRPDHESIQAALRAEPLLVSYSEAQRRILLGFPPAAAIAQVGYEAAPEFIARLGAPQGVDVLQGEDGQWLLRSRVPGRLQEVLSQVDRPVGRLRLQVDPVRLRG
jgi:primosomal protein N' (replication factor Y)